MDSKSIFSNARNVLGFADLQDWDDLGLMDQDSIEKLFDAAEEVTPDVVGSTYTAWVIWQAPDIIEPNTQTHVDIGRFCQYLYNWGVDFGTGMAYWDHLVNEIVASYYDKVEAKVVQDVNSEVRDLILRSYPIMALVSQRGKKRREPEDHYSGLWGTLHRKKLKSRQPSPQPIDDQIARIDAWVTSITPLASTDQSTSPGSLVAASSGSTQSDTQPETPTQTTEVDILEVNESSEDT